MSILERKIKISSACNSEKMLLDFSSLYAHVFSIRNVQLIYEQHSATICPERTGSIVKILSGRVGGQKSQYVEGGWIGSAKGQGLLEGLLVSFFLLEFCDSEWKMV